MGIKLTPYYANIYISNFEDQHVHIYQLQPVICRMGLQMTYSYYGDMGTMNESNLSSNQVLYIPP